MKRVFGVVFLLLMGLSHLEAEEPHVGLGVTGTVGSGDYWGLNFSGDFNWEIRDLAPHMGVNVITDKFSNLFVLSGGTWKKLSRILRVKGGLAYSKGKLKDPDESLSSISFETGLERDFSQVLLGGEYRYTSGTAGDPQSKPAAKKGVNDSIQGRKAVGSDLESHRIHTFSGYGVMDVAEGSLGLRLTWEDPSYAGSITSETFYYTFPAQESLFITPAVTFEQNSDSKTYFSLGAYYQFQ